MHDDAGGAAYSCMGEKTITNLGASAFGRDAALLILPTLVPDLEALSYSGLTAFSEGVDNGLPSLS